MCVMAAILDFCLPSIPHRGDFWRFYVFTRWVPAAVAAKINKSETDWQYTSGKQLYSHAIKKQRFHFLSSRRLEFEFVFAKLLGLISHAD